MDIESQENSNPNSYSKQRISSSEMKALMSSFGKDYKEPEDSYKEGKLKAKSLFTDVKLDEVLYGCHGRDKLIGKRTRREGSCYEDPFKHSPAVEFEKAKLMRQNEKLSSEFSYIIRILSK